MNNFKTFFRLTAPLWAIFLLNEFLLRFFKDFLIEHWFWVDLPLHLAGGFAASWTAWMFLGWLEKEKQAVVRPLWLKFALLIGFTAVAAILWEVYEFYHDMFFKDFVYQAGALDIMGDLANGLIGAILFCAGLYWRSRRDGSQIPSREGCPPQGGQGV